MATFRMPSLGSDMEDGTLVEWLKAPGDEVARGEIIAVVETQKGAIEIECFEVGTFDHALVETGRKVPVGTPLAVIRAPGEEGTAEAEPPPAPHPPEPMAASAEPAAPEPTAPEPEPAPELAPAPQPAPTSQPATATGTGRLRISPAARRRAEEAGLDPAVFAGAASPVQLADVEARLAGGAQPSSAAQPGDAGAGGALSEMRKAIAAAMTRSKREIPHYYLAHDIDLTGLNDRLATANAGRAPEDRLLPGAVYLHALAAVLKKFPELNGHFEDGAFRPSDAVNAGMAIRLRGGGLVAPAILGAEALDLDAIMAALRDLVSRARTGRFRASEFAAATITLTSLGDRGVDAMTGVITPPQVAIVGLGTPRQRPWVRDDAVVPRTVATLTLAADHRVSDGHRGALFLNALADRITSTEIP